MPELPDAVSDAVGAHQPASTPPFASLVRRRVRRRRVRAAAAVVAVLAVPALLVPVTLGGGSDEAELLAGGVRESLTVSFDATYDEARDGAALAACVRAAQPSLPDELDFAASSPPILFYPFAGSRQDYDSFVACLRSVPSAQVSVGGTSSEPARLFQVSVRYDRESYDEDVARADLFSCAGRFGAVVGLTDTSLPPIKHLDLTGTPSRLGELRTCLGRTPGATVTVDRGSGDASASTNLVLGVTYEHSSYETTSAEAELSRCTRTFGGVVTGQADSLPPQVNLTYSGMPEAAGQLINCLQQYPGATVTGQESAPAPGPEAPVSDPRDGPALWRPAGTTASTDTRIPILVTEQACANGESARGRVLPPTVTYGPDEVRVAVSVRGLGSATCPGNPETPYELVLREPLGDRELVDASR